MATLVLISSDNASRTIEVRIDGVRYEYWFHGDVQTLWVSAKTILRRGGSGKAINFLKSRAYKCERIVRE